MGPKDPGNEGIAGPLENEQNFPILVAAAPNFQWPIFPRGVRILVAVCGTGFRDAEKSVLPSIFKQAANAMLKLLERLLVTTQDY